MIPDEVVKELEALYKTGNNFLEADEPEAIRTAISLIQDYQKLRERIDVRKIEQLIGFDLQHLVAKVTDSNDYIKPDARIEGHRRSIAQAIITYLQQPTEPRAR